ncbi:MAG: SRPBCC family protein [Prolixibacteraceae bacterium]|nr:SRPBCC family protein [Prolixibacteraceae bacterium]
MGVSKYVSDIKTINNNNEVIFNYLSDFNNLSVFFNEFTLAQISRQIPKANIEDFESDSESCRFTISSVGEAGLRIIDREFPKTIKITGEGKIPFDLFLWIQILPVTPYQSKIRLTLHADMNMMIKMVAGKKMKDGINKLADAICMLPYQ